MATTRRFGPESSRTRLALLDAVEMVMREDGYGALSARSVATRAGLKHQLVYYYFQTFDDLLIATYQRHMDRNRARLEEALDTERPLHALWQVYTCAADASLNMEFLSLANHNEAIRVRTVAFGEHVRRLGLTRLKEGLRSRAVGNDVIVSLAVTAIISAVGSIFCLEATIGITGGHQETRRLVEWGLDLLEP